MAVHKSNLTEKPPSLVYRIVNSAVHGNTARVEWMGTSEFDANALAADASTPHEKSELEEAKDFLRDELSDGPMWAKQVFKDARDAGVKEITLRRAKTALGVQSEKIGVEGWQWRMPDKGDPDRPTKRDDHVDHVDHLQKSNGSSSPNSLYIKEGDQGDQDDQGDQRGCVEHVHDHLAGKEGCQGGLLGNVQPEADPPKKLTRLKMVRTEEKCNHNYPGGKGCYLCDPEHPSRKGGEA